MMSSLKPHWVLAAAVIVGAALFAVDSAADKSFTMKMEDTQRVAWEKSFTKLLHEPFAATLTCKSGSKLVLPAGEGCIELSKDKKICCKGFNIKLECTASKKWKQTSIDANTCSDPPKP